MSTNYIQLNKDDIELHLNGKISTIVRFKRSDLKAFHDIYQRLLKKYVKANTNIGTLLMDDEAYNDLILISEMIPVKGQKEKGIDFETLCEDLDLVNGLFFTTSFNTETYQTDYDTDEGLKPGLLIKLNRLDFFSVLQTATMEVREEKMRQMEMELETEQARTKKLEKV
jgi:hypothetical protein